MSEKKDTTVEAELEVTSSEGTETLRTFAKAWKQSLRAPRPTQGHFVRWARVDKEKK
jgi:hypothetical protein